MFVVGDDAEVVCDRFGGLFAYSRECLVEKPVHGLGEPSKVQMEAVVRHRPVHQAPQPLDRVQVRAWLLQAFGVGYSRPGAIKLMHRLGFEWVRPQRLPKQADAKAQEAFIKKYESLMNGLAANEKVVFADAVHPEHQSRPAHGWFRKADRPAVRATSGRQRMNIHGALDLEEMKLVRVEGERINAETTLALFQRIERAWPEARTIHGFADNARYHHAKMLKPWLERPECRLRLHFLPPYAPHLNPIERLWGLMHRPVTHNRFHLDFRRFTEAVDGFFDKTFPRIRKQATETVTDNFRVITHDEHCLIG